jgi:RNA polymerase sigma-70 factor (ECF subfamily)
LGTTDDIRTLADEELMVLVQSGDPRAFELLYDRHGGPAFSLAYRIAGQRPVAEDVTQEAFLSIWRSRERYQAARGSVRSWVLGIVHNRAVDGLRRNLVHDRRRASAEGLEDRPSTDPPVEVEAIRGEETLRVQTALRALPTDQTRVIELAYYGGYTHSEIADLLDAPVGTVKGRMRLGLQKLRHELEAAPA